MPATRFASGSALAYVLPRTIVVTDAALADRTVAALVDAGPASDVAAQLAARPEVAIVHRDGRGLHALVTGDRFVALVDDHRVGDGGGRSTRWRREHFEHASLIRVGCADGLGEARLPFSVDVGVVPTTVLERRLDPPPPESDPFVAMFGTTVNRPIEAAAVRERHVPADAAVLVGDDGRRISLDRPVLFGRHPNPDPSQAAARVVAVDRPDVSRRHASVTTDRWGVVVVDLGSVNGTTIQLPGCRPEPLPPGRRRPLVPGAVLRLGSDCVFTLEEAA